MVKGSRFFQVITLLVFGMKCGVGSSLADGGPPVPFYMEVDGDPEFMVYLILLNLCATIVVESLVVWWLLRRQITAMMRLLLWIIALNVMTNPALQCSVYFIADPVLWGSGAVALAFICLFEVLVFAIEYFFLRWAFGRLYRSGRINAPISGRKTAAIALVANLASFVVGLCTPGILLKLL